MHRGAAPAATEIAVEGGRGEQCRPGGGEELLAVVEALYYPESNAEVLRLVAAGADANFKDEYGTTPLLYASLNDRADVIEALLAHGADPNAEDEGRRTPLLSEKQADVVKALLAHGADPNAKNNDGRTPLHFASSDEVDVVKALLAHGADPNAKENEGGWTPLHMAGWVPGQVDVAEALLAHGADINAKDESGRTPLTPLQIVSRKSMCAGQVEATRVDQTEVTELLKSVGGSDVARGVHEEIVSPGQMCTTDGHERGGRTKDEAEGI